MITPASDRLYAIVRQLCDPEYQSPDPPTQEEMFEAVAAYEVERKADPTTWQVPQPEIVHGKPNDTAADPPAKVSTDHGAPGSHFTHA